MSDLRGIRVTYPDGTTEDVDCTAWSIREDMLLTETRHSGFSFSNYTPGPRFPLISIRKFEEIR